MKRNWTSKQSVVTLLVTLKNPKGLGFTVLIIVETGNAGFIENGEINGSDNLQNIDIQEVRV